MRRILKATVIDAQTHWGLQEYGVKVRFQDGATTDGVGERASRASAISGAFVGQLASLLQLHIGVLLQFHRPEHGLHPER